MMTLLQAIEALAAEIGGYSFQYEEAKMMNVQADEQAFPCVFFEEYREGEYRFRYYVTETTRVQLYFCKLCEASNTAAERERLRAEIKEEAVLPFIRAYNDSPLFAKIERWKFFTPPPRFDANEVSIMLQFDAAMTGSC